MKIGLVGFGKTGKAVANVIFQHEDFTLEWVLRKSPVLESRSVSDYLGYPSDDPARIFSIAQTSIEQLLDEHPVDFIIDFSSEDGIFLYGEAAAQRHVCIISAISHYKKETIAFAKNLSKKTAVFWSPNITLGVNFLMFAGTFLRKIAPMVDVAIAEEHFKLKKGVSGTALKMADMLDVETAGIRSVRAGGIVGKHEVIFGFPYQTVRLIHESISREAFGNGALFVASHMVGKKKGFYKFEDIFNGLLT